MQKRVLFVAHDSTLYGANQSLLDMVKALSLKNDMELVLVFPKKNKVICQQLDLLNLKYFIINYRTEIVGCSKQIHHFLVNFLKRIYKHLSNIFAYYKLSRIISKENINIIHSNSSVITIGIKIAKRKKIAHVWHLREHIGVDHDLRIFGGIEKYKNKIKNSDRIIAISHSVAKDFRVLDKAFIIHDAVAIRRSSYSMKETGKYFLFCGALKPLKGIETAIHAFQQFASVQNGYKLLVVGTGESKYESHLKKLVNELELSESVVFLGFRDDIQNLMSEACAFLMCSESEGLGRVTIEAMLNHCFVVGYDSTGTSEIITDGETGLLYKDLNHLVEQMKYLIENQKEIEVIKKNAYQYASKEFSERSYRDKIYRYYSGLLEK